MKEIKTAVLIGAALMLYSASAAAQLTNQGILDQVVTEFATRASSGQEVENLVFRKTVDQFVCQRLDARPQSLDLP